MQLYSASGQDEAVMQRQLIFVVFGYILMLIIAQIPLRVVALWVPLLFIIGLALLVMVLLGGEVTRGVRRWLEVFWLFRFQPSDVMKVLVPLTVAWYLAGQNLPVRFPHIVLSVAIILLPIVLIAMQPDLGTAILIALSGLFVLFLAGCPWIYIILMAVIFLTSMPLIWNYVLLGYQKQRFITLFNADSDPLGAGWNILQSKTAIGSGGIWGKGWLQGTQSQFNFLPESHTDFIIAVTGEEWGLFGILFLLALYIAILYRGFYIAWYTPKIFDQLVCAGITLMFFIYALVNMAMVAGVLPVVGVPLPLISLGGSSMITIMAGFGLLMAGANAMRKSI